jgi:phosphatidylglycerol---prolipoprotein diacylglyceryl transferase
MLATPLCIAYGLWKKVPIPRGMDIIAPCLLIGLGIGRVGCFLNGCCWGAPCDAPWAVTFPYDSPAYDAHVQEGRIQPPPAALRLPVPERPGMDRYATQEDLLRNPQLKPIAAAQRSLPIHPSQLYSTLAALLLAVTLVAFYTTAPAPGRVFALMMILEGFARFTIETLRVEPAVLTLGGVAFSYSMVVGALLVPAGVVAWFAFGLYDRRTRHERRAEESPNPALA